MNQLHVLFEADNIFQFHHYAGHNSYNSKRSVIVDKCGLLWISIVDKRHWRNLYPQAFHWNSNESLKPFTFPHTNALYVHNSLINVDNTPTFPLTMLDVSRETSRLKHLNKQKVRSESPGPKLLYRV